MDLVDYSFHSAVVEIAMFQTPIYTDGPGCNHWDMTRKFILALVRIIYNIT